MIFLQADKEYHHPAELLYRELEVRYGTPLFRTKALVLKIRLNLERFEIWRKLAVPLPMNFADLHEIIRIAFRWSGHHLHDFVLYDRGRPFVSIVGSGEEIDEFPRKEPMLLDGETKLQEFLPRIKDLRYTYDYGDNWEHIIEVEQVLFDYDRNYPVCLEGAGDRPPEDVGGEGGYEQFLEILGDPGHREYQSARDWLEWQPESGFNLDQVNTLLRHRF